MSDAVTAFSAEVDRNIEALKESEEVKLLASELFQHMTRLRYTYNFTWMGRPIIQMPQDILAMQEIIWKVKPGLIIETGVAHGGSLVFYASMLELLDNDGFVVGVELNLREHNRVALQMHPMWKRIRLVDGSSTDPATVEQVKQYAKRHTPVLVCLDSNHTHDHVLNELKLYAPLVSIGSYLVVFDTIIEALPDDTYTDRPWGKNNNPKTAVQEFLRTDDRFVIDDRIDAQLLLSVLPGGYLKRLK
jgi:cephalosporin hydroxylase